MSTSEQEVLIAGANTLHLTLSEIQVTQLLAYQALISKWNRVYNLTAVRDPQELFTGAEMGEDLTRVLASYHALRADLLVRIRGTIPSLERALLWADDVLTRSTH